MTRTREIWFGARERSAVLARRTSIACPDPQCHRTHYEVSEAAACAVRVEARHMAATKGAKRDVVKNSDTRLLRPAVCYLCGGAERVTRKIGLGQHPVEWPCDACFGTTKAKPHHCGKEMGPQGAPQIIGWECVVCGLSVNLEGTAAFTEKQIVGILKESAQRKEVLALQERFETLMAKPKVSGRRANKTAILNLAKDISFALEHPSNIHIAGLKAKLDELEQLLGSSSSRLCSGCDGSHYVERVFSGAPGEFKKVWWPCSVCGGDRKPVHCAADMIPCDGAWACVAHGCGIRVNPDLSPFLADACPKCGAGSLSPYSLADAYKCGRCQSVITGMELLALRARSGTATFVPTSPPRPSGLPSAPECASCHRVMTKLPSGRWGCGACGSGVYSMQADVDAQRKAIRRQFANGTISTGECNRY